MGLNTLGNKVHKVQLASEYRSAPQETVLGSVNQIVSKKEVKQLLSNNFFHKPGEDCYVSNRVNVLRDMHRTLSVVWDDNVSLPL